MRSKTIIAMLLAVTLVPALDACWAAKGEQLNLKKQLARQGFSGLLTGKVHIDELGSLRCGTQVFRVFFYEWEESHAPGKAIHASYRVIFFDRDRYIGSYSVEDRPIKPIRKSVRFDYAKGSGNEIACTDIGLGKNIVLNGGSEEFFK